VIPKQDSNRAISFEWIRQTVPHGSSSTNEGTSSV